MNAVQVLKEIERKRRNWDERYQFTIAGVGNLSQSDLDGIELYINYYKDGLSTLLMKPFGGVSEVLEKANISPYSFGNSYMF